jgi:hypothetical protein
MWLNPDWTPVLPWDRGKLLIKLRLPCFFFAVTSLKSASQVKLVQSFIRTGNSFKSVIFIKIHYVQIAATSLHSLR